MACTLCRWPFAFWYQKGSLFPQGTTFELSCYVHAHTHIPHLCSSFLLLAMPFVLLLDLSVCVGSTLVCNFVMALALRCYPSAFLHQREVYAHKEWLWNGVVTCLHTHSSPSSPFISTIARPASGCWVLGLHCPLEPCLPRHGRSIASIPTPSSKTRFVHVCVCVCVCVAIFWWSLLQCCLCLSLPLCEKTAIQDVEFSDPDGHPAQRRPRLSHHLDLCLPLWAGYLWKRSEWQNALIFLVFVLCDCHDSIPVRKTVNQRSLWRSIPVRKTVNQHSLWRGRHEKAFKSNQILYSGLTLWLIYFANRLFCEVHGYFAFYDPNASPRIIYWILPTCTYTCQSILGTPWEHE